MSTEDQRAPRPADSPSNEPLVWLGPVEWATVTGCRQASGFFVRMEEGGEEAFMELTSVDNNPVCRNEEYWPDVGERIRVRRLLSDREWLGTPRVASRASAMEGIVYGFPTQDLALPAGLGPVEPGVVVAHREEDLLVRLEDSGRVGVLPAHLLSYDPAEQARERWPKVGRRIRVRRLGVWPGGEIRLSYRKRFVCGHSLPPPGFFSSRTHRAFRGVIEYTRTLPPQVVERVRAVADAVSLHDWDQVGELTSGNRLDWDQADAFMTTYAWQPYTPTPDDFTRDMFAAPLQDGGSWVDCLLWTERERPSDVEISLKITPAPGAPDNLRTTLVRIRAIGFRYPGRCDQRPRPTGPAWTTTTIP